jgi:uncharacterized protein
MISSRGDSSMITKYITDRIDYDGSQLKPHFILSQFGIAGNACVAFIGSCDVKPEHMKDVEDLVAKKAIRSAQMLHFIAEIFRCDLLSGILFQRILIAITKEIIFKNSGKDIIRNGNDLFYESRKLSVSIATVSPISSLIHFGINISSDNTPIHTSCLLDLCLEPMDTANMILKTFEEEYNSIIHSIYKVRPSY